MSPSPAPSITTAAASLLTEPLAGAGAVGAPLAALLGAGAVRWLDARLIIEDPFAPRVPRAAAQPQAPGESQALPPLAETEAIDALLGKIAESGLGPHFLTLVGLFGAVLLELCGSPEQRSSVRSWSAAGVFGTFLMTDAGGPSLAQWRSTVRVEDQGSVLTIDKLHGINAHIPGFTLAAVRQPGSFVPRLYLISPEASAPLARRPVGEPWLGGALQLGNVRGETRVAATDLLGSGGLAGVNRFLTLVRPRFVAALMAHLAWLVRQGRVDLDEGAAAVHANVSALALAISDRRGSANASVDQVLALKFASNELLASLVLGGRVRRRDDERDLLGFSKMEGSSWRCLFELHGRRGRSRK